MKLFMVLEIGPVMHCSVDAIVALNGVRIDTLCQNNGEF